MASHKHPALYRHFDSTGRLLYVGKSLTPAGQRLDQHRADSHWFLEIAVVTIEHYATDVEAAVAERDAIKRERPLYNMVHSDRPKPFSTIQVNGMRAPLSPRERQILSLLGDGKTVSQIGVDLGLSVKTVSTYRSRIIEKMNVAGGSTVSLVNKARDLQLVSP